MRPAATSFRSEAAPSISAQRSVIEDAMEGSDIQSARRNLRVIAVALGCIGGGFALVPAVAQSDQQVRWCNGDDHATPDLMIKGCTALIRSKKFSGQDLAIAFTNRGSAYDDKRDEDRAIADYDEAIRLNPRFSAAFNNRGTTYRDDKRNAIRAIADYDEAIRINPKFADAYNNSGIALDNLGNRDRAQADYSSAIRFDPKFALAYNNRGLEYQEKGEYDAAIVDFSAAIAINSRYSNAYRNRGNAYVKKGDYDHAIPDFTAALGINAKDSETSVDRGIAYGRIGDYDHAIADYDNVIAINPQNIAALSNRGYAHFYRGDFADAAADLSRVMEKDFDSYSSLFRFLAQSRAGQAASDLEPAAKHMNSRDWPYAVFELISGGMMQRPRSPPRRSRKSAARRRSTSANGTCCRATAPPPNSASRKPSVAARKHSSNIPVPKPNCGGLGHSAATGGLSAQRKPRSASATTACAIIWRTGPRRSRSRRL
jgi:tetratricopeptide (TPR) repeat protein